LVFKSKFLLGHGDRNGKKFHRLLSHHDPNGQSINAFSPSGGHALILFVLSASSIARPGYLKDAGMVLNEYRLPQKDKLAGATICHSHIDILYRRGESFPHGNGMTLRQHCIQGHSYCKNTCSHLHIEDLLSVQKDHLWQQCCRP
jgi:hypothetical protein